MTLNSAFAAAAAALLLSGCANGVFSPLLLGSGISISEADAAELALIDRRDVILAAEGLTTSAELPAAGVATYNGIIHGFDGGGTGPDMIYYADLAVDVDFATDTLDGEVKNFVTDVVGFQNPTGTAAVVGTVDDAGVFAGIDFVGGGTLTGTTATADYLFATTTGSFAGDSAQAAFGDS